ncbi:ABC transporter permease [Amycolatopsis sp. CA-230715]|uniref:ABC transporter permease n=1 Tax=Amycolatopsis sp. CA-230715 TaxID=2745196 RepID=UPI001C02D642|nr:ABC transporter permease [Amycolatopsis sp. CA-230715]QWF78419.1 Dipeptide transport system permease protein DppC [Amycolatopsis sp. CA-230715]
MTAESLSEKDTVRAEGPSRRRLRLFLRNRLAKTGLGMLVVLVAFCFLGPLLYRTDQVHTALADAHLPPGSPGHPLGTDDVGFDLLGRLMAGGQTSLTIGLAAGLLATVIGTAWGAVAGYAGGWVDSVLMRIVDAGIAIPALFLLVVAGTMVTPSIGVLILVIGCVSWLAPARLMRAESLALRSRSYVEAMRLSGGTGLRAIGKHIVPNAIGTVIVNATFQVADAVLLVAYVSFLGLGVPPPAADWGGMLSQGLSYTYDGYWWLVFPPGLLIVATVCAFNFIGDGLRDAFDVRLKER